MRPYSPHRKKPPTYLFIAWTLSLVAQPAFAEWQPHQIKQADGRGGWITRPAQIQTIKHPGGENTRGEDLGRGTSSRELAEASRGLGEEELRHTPLRMLYHGVTGFLPPL